jgi:hypothetical protein
MNWRGEKKMRGTYHSRRAEGDATKERKKDTAKEKNNTRERESNTWQITLHEVERA